MSSQRILETLCHVPLTARDECFNFSRDKKHVDWVKTYLSIWTELQAYIKEFHTTGLAWSKTVSESFLLTQDGVHRSLRLWHDQGPGAMLVFQWRVERKRRRKGKKERLKKARVRLFISVQFQ